MTDWSSAISTNPDRVVRRAHTYHKKWNSFSRPVLLEVDGGDLFVVKAKQPDRPPVARTTVTDQIVGYLGRCVGAPVAEVGFVEIPAGLIEAEPELDHVSPGVWHGTCYISNVSDDKQGIRFADVDENRERFAQLAILFGWTEARDHQFVYKDQEPRIVFSVDHGHFLPGSTRWTSETLNASDPPEPDPSLVRRCSLTPDDLEAACGRLTDASDGEIAKAVARPYDSWGVTETERVTLAEFFSSRRDHLLEDLGAE